MIKKRLKKAVVSTMDEFGFPINNLDKIRSRRHYNCYRANYPSMYGPSNMRLLRVRYIETIMKT